VEEQIQEHAWDGFWLGEIGEDEISGSQGDEYNEDYCLLGCWQMVW
jgi:hypothetical protein